MTSYLSTDSSTLNDSALNQNRVNGRNDLPPEPLSKYYEERKKIIFRKKDVNSYENLYLNLLKKSQLMVNNKCSQCINGGFFGKLQDIYNLSVVLKENIANYSLVFSLYFIKGENLKAYKLFILMCEQNKTSINFLTSKIIEQLPKIANDNKIALFYPMITKTILQVLSIFIKLSGKFHKPTLEKQYIIFYFKIVHILSITVIRYKQGNNIEISNQLKNERRYFYASFLFDSSLYLFNRYQPLSTIIDILQHILELYGNKLTFYPDEIESILLLKASFNLGLFCYVNGNNNESINNLIQAREKVLDIKYFPKSTTKNKNITFPREENNNMFHNLPKVNNSSTNLYNFNEYNIDIISSINITRSKNKRTSLNSCIYGHSNERKALDNFKERNSRNNKEYVNRNLKPRYFSNIYLGVYSLLTSQSPILLDQVKEKIIVEIELLLSEIELNRKNYKESLDHINAILNMNSFGISNNNLLESREINKSKTINNLLKNANTANGINENEENKNSSKFMLSIKSTAPSDSNLLWINRKKNIINNNKTHPLDNMKLTNYMLTNSDRNRMMFILENIENANNGNQNISSDSESLPKFNKSIIKKNEGLNKDKKIITSKEMEKFFIFICSLSLYQLKILNQSQPEPSEKRNDLPIVFNNQFQDCLTNAQRMSLSFLETMSLTRYIILKDTNKEICPENLDYRFMKYRLKDTDSDDGKSKKIKNNRYIKELNGIKRCSSCETFNLNHNYTSRNIQFEFEEENSDVDIVLNKIISDENKNFIRYHRNSIITFIKQMSKEEQKLVLDNPKLLKNIINKISKKYNLKLLENGGNENTINDKHINFLFEKKSNLNNY